MLIEEPNSHFAKPVLCAVFYSRICIAGNGSGLCVVALSRNLKLTTTLDGAITQNPCYVPLILSKW